MDPFNVTPWFRITIDMAVKGLLTILDVFGEDYRAPQDGDEVRCIYVERDVSGALVPVCIVGALFARWGILGALVETPNSNHSGIAASGSEVCNLSSFTLTANRLAERGIVVDNEAIALLAKAQGEQDKGKTWGYAVEAALETVAVNHGVDYRKPQTHTEAARTALLS